MNEYIKSGFAQPLDELYEKYGLKGRFMEGALEQVSFNGKIYGVPVKNISIAGIYYNKDLFDKYNVKVPSTVSELEKASDTFLANGIIPFCSCQWAQMDRFHVFSVSGSQERRPGTISECM